MVPEKEIFESLIRMTPKIPSGRTVSLFVYVCVCVCVCACVCACVMRKTICASIYTAGIYLPLYLC